MEQFPAAASEGCRSPKCLHLKALVMERPSPMHLKPELRFGCPSLSRRFAGAADHMDRGSSQTEKYTATTLQEDQERG
jgi:hypothetical protein